MLIDRKCTSCNYIASDQIEQFDDSKTKECPKCKQNTLERILYYSNCFEIKGHSYKNGYNNINNTSTNNTNNN